MSSIESKLHARTFRFLHARLDPFPCFLCVPVYLVIIGLQKIQAVMFSWLTNTEPTQIITNLNFKRSLFNSNWKTTVTWETIIIRLSHTICCEQKNFHSCCASTMEMTTFLYCIKFIAIAKSMRLLRATRWHQQWRVGFFVALVNWKKRALSTFDSSYSCLVISLHWKLGNQIDTVPGSVQFHPNMEARSLVTCDPWVVLRSLWACMWSGSCRILNVPLSRYAITETIVTSDLTAYR